MNQLVWPNLIQPTSLFVFPSFLHRNFSHAHYQRLCLACRFHCKVETASRGTLERGSLSVDILTHLPVVHLRRHCVGHNDVCSQVLLDQVRVQGVVGVRRFT